MAGVRGDGQCSAVVCRNPETVDAPVFQKLRPVQFAPGMISDGGEVTVTTTEEFLRNDMLEFRAHVERVLTVLPNEA